MCEFAISHAKLPFVNDTRDLLSELSLWRRPQDSNLQGSYAQQFSRLLPHHPDRRRIVYWEVFLLLLVTNISPAVRNLDRRPRNIPFWWVRMDSNHRSPKTPDLQSGAFDHSATYPYIRRLNKSYFFHFIFYWSNYIIYDFVFIF